MEEGSPVYIINLSFQKALDKLPHQRLIIKLKSHGTGISIINWIEQWLSDRRQSVVVDVEATNWKPVFEWGTTLICTRACLIFNIHQWSRRRGNKENIENC